MKKYLWFLFCIASLSFMSCNEDEVFPGSPNNPVKPNPPGPNNPAVPDTTKPVIQISSPNSNADLMVIDRLKVYANISDNTGLESVRLFLVDPDGTRKEMEGLAHLRSLNKAVNTIVQFYMHLPTIAEVGTYTIVIQAEDTKQNIAKDSIRFNVYAPDFAKPEFAEVFFRNSFISALADWEENFLTPNSFSSGFYYVMDRDNDNNILKAEWEKFVLDFNLKNRDWTTWDTDGDGSLSAAEFKNGLSNSRLFHELDTNKNDLISAEELAEGLFSRWDNNRDGKLTRSEYHQRLSTYFYF
ncbi:hypothetical protein H9Q13_04140 [Pontibacter sp. JH31]|uniref:EF-hand domain-containing protein n=1 Tax=Pontibacter aquaedesilientis TaxID=2766980 RepID=A0ABR7XDI5_9BACT|nr:hypothetical protein [Pontibacter aquaedesilientis]MBD1396344.1 hypothetical protein [Pontibacter aquaedesilientis]